MITRVSSVGVRAGDQDRAIEFYVGKLGFEKRRWGRWAQFRDPDGNEHGLIERA